jgi:hypothetical protein
MNTTEKGYSSTRLVMRAFIIQINLFVFTFKGSSRFIYCEAPMNFHRLPNIRQEAELGLQRMSSPTISS